VGIRFRCHHCEHELHVKDFQAGKRGRCPACKQKFRIPLSDAAHSLDVDTPVATVAAQGEAPRQSTPAPTESIQAASRSAQPPESARPLSAGKSSPSSLSKKNAQLKSRTEVEGTQDALHPPLAETDLPKSEPLAAQSEGAGQPVLAAALSPSDPQALREAPDAIWYVRPTSGGQYGPAPSPSMLQWLKEQRVGRDALVWRDGWPEWLAASQVFADYFEHVGDVEGAITSSAAPQPAGAALSNLGGTTESLSSAPRSLGQRKRKRRRNYILMIASLSIVTLALVVSLIVVLLRQA
jgi:DNA-directed RNA polymerase subunit RPC12/RpoP